MTTRAPRRKKSWRRRVMMPFFYRHPRLYHLGRPLWRRSVWLAMRGRFHLDQWTGGNRLLAHAPNVLEVDVDTIHFVAPDEQESTRADRPVVTVNSAAAKPQIEVEIDSRGRFALRSGSAALGRAREAGMRKVTVLVGHRDPRWEHLRRELAFFVRFHGQLYQRVLHPDIDFLRAGQRCTERIDLVRPHLPRHLKTVVDLGANLGTFSRFLEDEGFEVTAVEQDPTVHFYLRLIRDTMGYRFRVFPHDIRKLVPDKRIDVLWALSVLHWFTKTKPDHDSLIELLGRLSPTMIFFQPPNGNEYNNESRYRIYQADEFAELVRQWSNLTRVEKLGVADTRRPIYLID